MYIARLGEGFVVKRMPETGSQHAPGCLSFESSEDASGRSALLASAIREDPGTGLTALRLDFSLSTGIGHSTPPCPGSAGTTAKTRGSKLSLIGLLHYLWEQAGLTRWQPSFAGKRSWGVVRRRLREVAAHQTVRGQPLLGRLYVPEPFSTEHRDAICARRSAQWAATAEGRGAQRPRMLLIGEVKELSAARHGFKTVVKHAPDLSFMIDEHLFRQLERKFAQQLGLWSATDDIRMVVIATFSTAGSGVPLLAELSLMPTTRDWLPVESIFENLLIGRLVAEERRFLKGLRYDLRSDVPIAAATLTDCGVPAPLLHIQTGGPPPHLDTPALDASQPPESRGWNWRVNEESMPAFPPSARTDVPS
jgi:hypothetical protein